MGKDIRNYEFKTQNAQAFVNDKGELKFEGKKKKELEQLQPLFDAILKADKSSTKNKKKLDSDTEKDLMNKLHTLLMADGKVDATELKLGDEFVKSGKSVAEFINEKIAKANSTKETKEVKEEPVAEVEEEPVAQEPVTEVVTEEVKEEERTPVVERRPDPRVSQNAFNQAIQNQRVRIQDKKDELTTAFTKEVTVDKGVYLYNVAVQALKDEGVEHPNAKQINDRIAEIALVNDISDVNRVPKGKVIKVGRVGSPVQPAAEASPTVGESPVTPTTVAPSSITVQEKPVPETLTELEYSAEEKVDGEGDNALTYKEWTKEGFTTMYTTEVDGVTLTADSLEKLKELKTQFAAATITAAPESEAADAKATRQAANLENMKKRIELSGGDIGVIEDVIDKLRADGNVNLESEDVQAFVQDLARTKNVEVLTKLLVNSEDNFTNDLIKNEDTAKTVASLYKEIRDKENASEKLTDDEIALKEFMATKVKNYELYQIAVDSDNDVAEKSIYFNEKSGEIAYSSGDYYANDPKVLDGFVKAINEANAATKNDTIPDDTDDNAKERALAAVFKQYVNTEDKMLANCIASKADALHASKDDVLALVAKSDMFVLDSLNFTPSAEDSPAFNKAVADRVVALYEAGNGDPANMRYLETALANIDAATYDPEEDKQKAKDKVLESFFEVTGEGENKEYTFKPSRRPAQEEIYIMLCNIPAGMQKAVLDSVTSIDDLGKGQYTQSLETDAQYITTADLKAKYAELFEKAVAEFDLENDLEGAQAKVLKFIEAVGENIDLIPFGKIQENFGDVTFVKDYLGPLKNENENILRKLTLLDLDIKETESDGNVTYNVSFSIAANVDYNADVAHIVLSAASKEELLAKAEQYIELQNIVYEAKTNEASSKFTDTERGINMARLKEIFNDENIDKDVKLSVVNFVVGKWDLYDEELIDNIIDTKDPDFIKEESIVGREGVKLNPTQMATLIDYAVKPKLEDGNDNPFYLGTESGNQIRNVIINSGNKEQITAIYDSLRSSDQLYVLSKHFEFFEDANDKFEQLINKVIDTNEQDVAFAFVEVLELAMDKQLTLSQETANKLMNKIQRPLPVHDGREPIYSWADFFGNTIFYRKKTGSDGKVTFERCTASDYAKEIKYETDNNGTSHTKEKLQAEALSRLSSSGVADVVLAYSESGKGIIKDWNDEYALFGDALGVDDMMPVINKVLYYGSEANKRSDEYNALLDLVQPFKDENGKVNTTKDFSSDIATKIDNAMIAYIKKVRNIT